MKTQKIKITIARFALSAPLALAAAGCMVGPNYKRPVTHMSPAYREAVAGATTAPSFVNTEAAAEIRWWRELGDEELTKLVEQSLTANYGIAVAEARLREARASRQMAQAMLYPQVSVGASALRFRGSDSIVNLPLGGEDGLFQLGFDANWTVDLFGGIRRGVESAKANEQATNAERRGVVLMVAAETARAYLELRGTQLELQIAETTLEEQRQTLASPRISVEMVWLRTWKCCGANRSGRDRRRNPAASASDQAIHPRSIDAAGSGTDGAQRRA